MLTESSYNEASILVSREEEVKQARLASKTEGEHHYKDKLDFIPKPFISGHKNISSRYWKN
jgi:hypothetical protein